MQRAKAMVIVYLAALLAACSGTEGKQGAVGQKGADGTNGKPGPAGPVKPPRLLDTRIGGWLQQNRDAIDALIAAKGIASATFDGAKRPVAVFDWDNTMMKNDIGDATMFFMVQHDKIL